MAIARVIRLGFAQQNAYHPSDVYTPLTRQLTMMEIILYLHDVCHRLVDDGISMDMIQKEGIFERIIAVKYKDYNSDEEMRETHFKEIDAFSAKVM